MMFEVRSVDDTRDKPPAAGSIPSGDTAAAAIARGGSLPKQARLLRHADFERVYKGGRRLFSANMTVFWLRREAGSEQAERVLPGTSGPRIGFTVGRVLGGSVVRNRIRRRMREAVRLSRERLTAPVDVVINPKKSAQVAAFEQLLQDVAEAFRGIAAGRGVAAGSRSAPRKRGKGQASSKR